MAFLTTDAPTSDYVCRRFRIPVTLLPNFMGALDALTIPDLWEAFGDMTPDESASAYLEVISTQGDNCMVGTVFPYLTENPPDGSLALDGTTYNGVDFPLLYSTLDPTWLNGDGTFTLPNVSGRTIVGAGAGAGLTNRVVGDTLGTEVHALSIEEMPAHTHSYDQIAATLIGDNPPPAIIGIDDINTVQTGSTGGGEPHNNMQPSIVLNMAVWFR